MLIRQAPDLRESDVTDKALYLRRREFITAGTALGLVGCGQETAEAAPLAAKASALSTTEKKTPKADITSYNNYYEFGTDKGDPVLTAGKLKTRPWTITVEGEALKPKTYAIEGLLKSFPLEERIYRLRCVERWSMVIPWIGFPLASLLKQVEPSSKAKYVAFETAYRPKEMPGVSFPALDWPYKEGLRIDEAMHPLTLLAVGLYGETLPNQNGAPVRLVVPWKYGFKSIKSIVRIRLQEKQPRTAWNDSNAEEYGFYSNVNPKHDHPRWSQASERRIGELLPRPTLMFNGYADQVASLYRGMDLNKFY